MCVRLWGGLPRWGSQEARQLGRPDWSSRAAPSAAHVTTPSVREKISDAEPNPSSGLPSAAGTSTCKIATSKSVQG